MTTLIYSKKSMSYYLDDDTFLIRTLKLRKPSNILNFFLLGAQIMKFVF